MLDVDPFEESDSFGASKRSSPNEIVTPSTNGGVNQRVATVVLRLAPPRVDPAEDHV